MRYFNVGILDFLREKNIRDVALAFRSFEQRQDIFRRRNERIVKVKDTYKESWIITACVPVS